MCYYFSGGIEINVVPVEIVPNPTLWDPMRNFLWKFFILGMLAIIGTEF
jgi:hypothetical protein